MINGSKRAGRGAVVAGGKAYAFRLFVAGNESNSTQARGNLVRLCEEHLKGRYQIDIVDVWKDPAIALKYSVLLTPMLIMLKPRLGVSVLGNLSDTKQVLATLRLIGDER
jgi:circadian clock protein KaiB